MMLALHTPVDGMANYSHYLKGISDAPEHILSSPQSVHTNVISNLFKKKCRTNKKLRNYKHLQYNFLCIETLKLITVFSVTERNVMNNFVLSKNKLSCGQEGQNYWGREDKTWLDGQYQYLMQNIYIYIYRRLRWSSG
jgi:hypothetical protein